MRPRKPANRALPVNLYKNGRYYQYRHPQTGHYHGMGTDRAAAIRAAHHLNAQLIETISLTDRVLGSRSTTSPHRISSSPTLLFSNWLDTYTTLLDERGLSKLSRYNRQRQVERIRDALGALDTSAITTRCIAEFLDAQTPRQANAYRSVLNDCFNEAIAKGHITTNPVTVTKNKRVATQRQRLTLEDFQRIHAASPIHLQNALDLGLITLQRREDLATLSWSDLHDDVLELRQHKTGTRLRITVTEPLARVLDACRSNLNSPWVLHYRRASPHTHAGDPIAKQQLSAMFRTVRDSLGLYAELPIRQRPSFHEIRSLGARLYEARGMDPQTLLGHKSRQMTEVYLDSRREEWLVASPAVDILEGFRESFDKPS